MIDVSKLRGKFRVLAATGRWQIGDIIDFDPPLPMPPLPKNNGRAKKLRHNLKWMEKQRRG